MYFGRDEPVNLSKKTLAALKCDGAIPNQNVILQKQSLAGKKPEMIFEDQEDPHNPPYRAGHYWKRYLVMFLIHFHFFALKMLFLKIYVLFSQFPIKL